MELELGLALPNARPPAGELGVLLSGKRGFGEAFGADKATLPLFVRGDEGADGDGGGGVVVDRETSSKRTKRLVGWPPVKCAHRLGCGGGGYVKVKMEGVANGRKVDVSLHGSYDQLLRTLDRMFPPPSANHGGGADAEEDVAGRHDQRRRRHPYVVTYEDGEGDWLLVGDVPWEAFAMSVKRLKILA